MHPIRYLPLLLALLGFNALAADTPQATATRLLDRMDARDYAGAEAMFSPQMKAAVPADKLKAVWESLPAQLGAARGRGEPQISAQSQPRTVVVPLAYDKGTLLANIAIDGDGRIVGFLLQPAPPPSAAPPAADAGFIEKDFAVPGGRGELPGTLALPKGVAPFPAVVLVHGSGPHDRDETIGPNRPFLDIARGLAAQGIAVLRYEKRSKARPQDFADGRFTMDDETTDDAVRAVAALAGADGIDAARIYVLGHSQGGMLAPRIAARSGQVAGLILLAAPARPLLTLLAEQNQRLAGVDGEISAAERAALDDLARKISNVRGTGEIAVADSPMGLPAHYWREAEKIDAVADARNAALPLLVLQGGRDMQVVDADWTRWRQAFADDPRATLRRYPALNHLGIAGEGEPTLAEYQRPGHVDTVLIDDIAGWINRR